MTYASKDDVDVCEWERRVRRDPERDFCESLRKHQFCSYNEGNLSSVPNAQVIIQETIGAASVPVTGSKCVHGAY